MADLALTPALVVAGIALVVALIATILAFGARRRLSALNRLASGEQGSELAAGLLRLEGQVRELRSDLMVVHDNTQLLRQLSKDPFSHWSLVKFDAFNDMAGGLSFALALLDEQGDGVVLTSMVGRTDTRMYAKTVAGGAVNDTMTDEEAIAVERAVSRERSPLRVTREDGKPVVVEAT